LCAARSDQRASLVSQSKVGDDLSVTLDIGAPEVIQKAATTSYHLQEPATAVMILRVGSEVVGEVVDSCREKGDLNFGRSAVVFMSAVLL
jgi:hypothetical protein